MLRKRKAGGRIVLDGIYTSCGRCRGELRISRSIAGVWMLVCEAGCGCDIRYPRRRLLVALFGWMF